MTDEEYAKKEQGRDHFTVTLNLTPQEGEKVALSLQHFDGSYYSALAHNCTMPMQQALKGIGLSIPLPLITPDSFVQTLTDNGLVKEVKDR